jgi:hypothetical protein
MGTGMEIGDSVFLAQGKTPCPFGLMNELQTIQAILYRMDIPRGQIPIQLYLNLLRGRALGSPLERKIQITELIKGTFGDMYGDLVHLSFHVTNTNRLGEDARSKLKCDAECAACQIRADDRLPDEMARLKKALSKRSVWD